MKVYIDSNNIVHPDATEGYSEAEHEFFDTIPTMAFDCYKFIPERNFIQCVDTKTAEKIIAKFPMDEANTDDMSAALEALGVDMSEEA